MHTMPTFILIFGLFIVTNIHIADERYKIITAIQDNGCSKQTQIEIKPAVYNTWPNNKGVM